MSPDEARERLRGDAWHADVQAKLGRTEQLIGESRARIAEHAAAMRRIDRNGPTSALRAMSRDLHLNLEEGLKLLVDHRAMLVRELRSIERRKAVQAGAAP